MGLLLLPLCLLAVAAIRGAGAVEYFAVNNAAGTHGGDRFQREVGLDYSKQVLADASSFVHDTLGPDLKNADRVTLVVEDRDGVAATGGGTIFLSAGYVGGYDGDVRKEVVGVLYHEVTHVWQSDGPPGWLVEGIADYVRLKAGYASERWVRAGEGGRWDEVYNGATAHFLDYCESVSSGFVAAINQRMRVGYDDGFFAERLGKTVEQVWADYKAKYGG